MTALPHHENRTGTVLNKFRGNAAKEESGDGAKALRAGHDEVRLMLVSHLDDLIGWMSKFQRSTDGMASLDESFGISIEQNLPGFFQFRISEEWHDMDHHDVDVL